MNDKSEIPQNYRSEFPLQSELIWIIRSAIKNIKILGLTLFIGISLSLFLALTAQEIYRAEMVIKSSDERNRSMFSQISSQINGIAGSLGMGLGQQNAQGYSAAVATLYSKVFLYGYIEDNNLLKALYENDWDYESDTWKDPESKPSMEDAYEDFSQRIFLNRDERTGIINFAIEWTDPKQAAELANDLITSVNTYLRDKEIENISNNIQYLQDELSQTSIVNAQAVVFKVIEEQTKAIMMANVTEEYAFEIIDPAVSPDERIKPSRRLIVMIGAMLSFLSGIILIIIKEALPKLSKLLQLASIES